MVEEARAIAAHLLEDHLPQRWLHVMAVAERAETLAAALPADGRTLVSAAWLHDIGYSAALIQTAFHPLDGARHLRRIGFDQRVTGLVAHHSGAVIEADLRGLGTELRNEFPREHTIISDALWTCDFTTGPDGASVSVSERLEEIRSRYGADHVVTRFTEHAEAELRAAVARVSAYFGAANGR